MRGPALASTCTLAGFGLLFIADKQFAGSGCVVLSVEGQDPPDCCGFVTCWSCVRVITHEGLGVANAGTETFPACQARSVLRPSLWAVWLLGCPSPGDVIWCDSPAG